MERGASIPPPVLTDEQRLARLVRMKRFATGLLVAMALLFVVTRLLETRWPWLAYIRAFAEAAMIGAIADWFAVTALFRHPLGIPIPHTAIIPSRKENLAISFGRFVTNNFLDPEVIAQRLRKADAARRLGHWLSRPERSRVIADATAEVIVGALQVIADDDVNALIQRGFVERAKSVAISPIVGRTLALVADDDRQRRVFYGATESIARWVEANQGLIRRRIIGELPGWLQPFDLDRRIYEKIFDVVQKTLHEIREDPNHPLYAQFSANVAKLIEDLQTSPELQAQGEQLKAEALSHPIVREAASSIWADIKVSLISQARQPDSALHTSIQQGIARFGEAIEQDPAWREKIEGWLEVIARYLVSRYGSSVGQFMTQTIRDWDADATSRRLELLVGRDLQFIRINGTLVGGAAGLLIYLVSHHLM